MLLKATVMWPLLFVIVACQEKKSEPVIEALPVINTLPDFTFTNQRGEEFGPKHLKGRVFLANFIFTRCPSVCPVMLEKTAKFLSETKDYGISVVFVTFTVDPDHDTVPVLRKKAEELQADPERWVFLTHTDKSVMMTLFKDGFKVGVSEPLIAKDLFDIAHSEKIVLVDKQSRVRGYYSYDEPGLVQLKKDLASIHQETY
jgi:protein SCO1/2